MDRFDFESKCKKCGGPHESQIMLTEPLVTFVKGPWIWDGGKIKRQCRRCTHIWYELPLDAPEAPK